MKQIRIFFLGIAFVAVFFAGTSIAADAPDAPLDHTWFELKISSKAFSVYADNETLSKENIKMTAYMFIMQGGDEYEYAIICEDESGKWNDLTGGIFPVSNPTEDDIFMGTHEWNLVTQDGTPILILLSGQFKLKRNKGILKNASFSTLGAFIDDSDTEIPWYGGVKVKGKTIDDDKLPFELP